MSLLWEHAPFRSSEGNDIFKNAILGGGRNKTIQLCLNILRLSLRLLLFSLEIEQNSQNNFFYSEIQSLSGLPQ